MRFLKISLFLLIPLLCIGQGYNKHSNHSKYDNYSTETIASTPSVSYEAEASALFARMSPAPSTARKTVINTYIKGLKDNSLWSTIDALWVYAAHSEAPALLNWIEDDHNCTNNHSTSFLTDSGFVGVGANDYLSTDFIASTDTVAASAISMSLGGYLLVNNQETSRILGARDGTNKTFAEVGRPGGGARYISINGITAPQRTTATTLGLIMGTRTEATTVFWYQNADSIGANGQNSSALPTVEWYVMCDNNNGSTDLFITNKISMAFIAAGWTTTQYTNFYTLTEAYMDAVGCGVNP